jgi:hypothetical protein
MLGVVGWALLQAGSAAAWQQEVHYRITASLDEANAIVRGRQELLYHNRSPDTLRSIVFRFPLNPGPGTASTERSGNRVFEGQIGGIRVSPEFPLAPDSTLVRFPLPRMLAPGDSLTLALAWEARLPRRSPAAAWSGRHFDLVHWYPEVAVYDHRGWHQHTVSATGERYGEFGTALVRFETAKDQVLAFPGVPLCGDPGWEKARRPAGGRVDLQRNWYANPRDSAAVTAGSDGACDHPEPDRKVVVWYAEDLPHVVLSLDPEFRYEEGDIFDRPVRVFYRPGAERIWGAGLAVRRTETALAWLVEAFDEASSWPWPNFTIVHRLDEDAEGYPMVALTPAVDQETVLEAVGYSYLLGTLASDEWDESWLAEGLARFQSTRFLETLGSRGAYQSLERQVLEWDLDRLSEPVAQPADSFRSHQSRRAMIESRGELFFHQLRAIVGPAAMARILKGYFSRYRFKRVDEAAFRAVAEEISGQDLDRFFQQWLHETVLYDYRVRRIRRSHSAAGWQTTIEVSAEQPGLFPAELWVIADRDTARTRLKGLTPAETLTVMTRTRPRSVSIDPSARSHDWNALNNERRFGFFGGGRRAHVYLDLYFSRRSRRDRVTMGLAPAVWYNDAGGWTLGLRNRTDYLNRFRLNEIWYGFPTGWGVDDVPDRFSIWIAFRNPTWLRAPGVAATLEGGRVEGRAGGALRIEYQRPSFTLSPRARWSLQLQFVTTAGVEELRYLDSTQWDDARTIELEGGMRTTAGRFQIELAVAGGHAAPRRGAPVRRQAYLRTTGSVAVRQPLGGRFYGTARGFAGLATAGAGVVRQRLIPLGSADPVTQWRSPFLRSRGALFRREGVHYHEPGGAGVRGLGPEVLARQAYGLTLELERELRRGEDGLLNRVSAAGFADGGLADGDLDPAGNNRIHGVADAGVGLRVDHRIGRTRFQTRIDLPVWVSRPALAQDRGSGSSRLRLRWLFSFKAPLKAPV